MAKEKNEPWFAEKRAMAYAYALLAEHNLRLRTEEKDFGIDLIADIESEDRFTGRAFGIEVSGFIEFPSISELNKRLTQSWVYKHADKLAIPIVWFVVRFKKLDAVYTWLIEPGVEDGIPQLNRPIERDWAALNDKAVTQILKQVESFYDAMLGSTKVKKSGKNHN